MKTNSTTAKLTLAEQTNHELGLKNAKVHKTSELELIDNLKVADELGYYRKLGFSSLYEYANRGLELDEAASYKLMAIARKSIKVPELKMALESGSMTVSNAKVLVSVITPENKDHWIGLAQDLTKPKLEREVAKVSPKAAVQERASVVTEDLMKVVMALSNESHEILKRALDLVSQRMGKAASYDDAIKAMGAIYLKAKDPVQRAKRAEERSKANCPSGTVEERIDFLSKTPPASQKIDIPFVRSPRPALLRHQVTTRDQARCTHINDEGLRCESRRWLQVHHKILISHGGTNDLRNLTTLCGAHHSMRHQ